MRESDVSCTMSSCACLHRTFLPLGKRKRSVEEEVDVEKQEVCCVYEYEYETAKSTRETV